MADGYTGYNKVQEIKRCCFAHIRRYFFDAIPKGKNRDISCPAVQGVEYCDKLFAYERQFKEKRPTEEMADSELEKLLPWNDKVFEMCKIER